MSSKKCKVLDIGPYHVSHSHYLSARRSPSYNYTRLMVSGLISFVLASPFVTNRKPDAFTENDMRSRVSVIFLTFIITGIMSILSGKYKFCDMASNSP